MNTRQPHGPHDDRFAAAYTRLVDDLATVLDLTTGADEATQSATYDTLTADLGTALHLDAGLTAIIGGPRPPAPPAGGPASTASSTSSDGRVVDHLGSLTDPERLRLRARPSYRGLRRVLALVPNLDLIRARDLAPTGALTGDLDLALACARDLARGLDDDIARDLARYLADHALTHVLDLAHARDRAHELVLVLARALDIDRARARARARASDRAHALDRELALALDLARELALALALNLDLDLTWTEIASVLEDLTEVADNFVGADLRAAVDFDSTGWEGIRWSPSTAWPPGWENRVRAISIEIAPGIFQVGRDGRDSLSLHEIST